MNAFVIICICLLSINILLGFGMLLNRKRFLNISPDDDIETAIKKCFHIPGIVFIVEMFVSVGEGATLFGGICMNDTLNRNFSIVFYGLMIGWVLGYIFGIPYWIAVKKPYFEDRFQDEFDNFVYGENTRRYYGNSYRTRTIYNFVFPLCALGLLIGLIIAICIPPQGEPSIIFR